MELTVKKALTFGGLTRANLIAGQGGVEQPINTTFAYRTAKELAEAAKQRDILYLATFTTFGTDEEKQKKLIRNLADANGSGLVLYKGKANQAEPTPGAVALSDELDFPLILAADQSAAGDIADPIQAWLVEKPHAPQTSYADIQSDIIDLLVAETDLSNLLARLAERLHTHIFYYDIYSDRTYADQADVDIDHLALWIHENFHLLCREEDENALACYEQDNIRYLVKPIQIRQNLAGLLIFPLGAEQDAEELRDAVRIVGTVCVLTMFNRDRLAPPGERELHDFVTNLLVWNFRSSDAAIKHGWENGVDISNVNTLMVLCADITASTDEQAFQRKLRQEVFPYVKEAVQVFDPASIILQRSNTLLIMLNNADGRLDMERIAAKCHQLYTNKKITVYMGLSDPFNEPVEIPEAYRQAFRAAEIGREQFEPNHLTTFSQIWFIDHFHGLRHDATAVRISRELLEPLRRYDRSQSTQLTETLRLLLHYNNDILRLSKIMFLHRNTILYRKNKIIEILGYSPFEMPYMLNFIVAFEIDAFINHTK